MRPCSGQVEPWPLSGTYARTLISELPRRSSRVIAGQRIGMRAGNASFGMCVRPAHFGGAEPACVFVAGGVQKDRICVGDSSMRIRPGWLRTAGTRGDAISGAATFCDRRRRGCTGSRRHRWDLRGVMLGDDRLGRRSPEAKPVNARRFRCDASRRVLMSRTSLSRVSCCPPRREAVRSRCAGEPAVASGV